jgi:peptidoglycan/xylan/chitin deacetylase (PgdA/CDA1 family)
LVLLRRLLLLALAVVPVLVPFQGGVGLATGGTRPQADEPSGAGLTRPVPMSGGATANRRTHASSLPDRLPTDYPTFLRPLEGEPRHHVTKGPRPMRELVLTFDDGPDLMGTPLVLEELDRRGYKAIFFVNGRHFMGSRPQDFARRDLVRKMAAHGHLVANHTLTHQDVCKEPEKLAHQIDDNAELIAGATGIRPVLFRAPYGVRCKKLDQALRARDLLQVGWNMDPQEWRGGSEDGTYDYVTKALEHFTGRAVLLLHDTHGEAVRALPRIFDWIAHENDRARRAGALPIVVRDYSVFLPQPAPVETGFEPFLADLGATLSVLPAAVGR